MMKELTPRQCDVLRKFAQNLKKCHINKTYSLMGAGQAHQGLLDSSEPGMSLQEQLDIRTIKSAILDLQAAINSKKEQLNSLLPNAAMNLILSEEQMQDLMDKMARTRVEKTAIYREIQNLEENLRKNQVAFQRRFTTPYLDAFKAVSSDNISNLLHLMTTRNYHDRIDIRLNDFKSIDGELTSYFYKYRHIDARLSSKKLRFFKDFMSLTFFLHHKTTAPEEINTLRSKYWLDTNGVCYTSVTQAMDIQALNDVDFVFFYLNPQKSVSYKSRFGSRCITIPANKKFFEQNFIYMTLGDYASDFSGGDPQIEVIGSKLIGNAIRDNTTKLGDTNGIFYEDMGQELYKLIRYQAFMGADILKGIALLIIYLRRKYFNTKNQCKSDLSFLDSILLVKHNDEAYLGKLNALMNGWIRPIIKVPKRINIV